MSEAAQAALSEPRLDALDELWGRDGKIPKHLHDGR